MSKGKTEPGGRFRAQPRRAQPSRAPNRLRRRLTAAAMAAAVTVPVLAACSSSSPDGVLNVYAAADGFDYVKQFAETCSKESGGRYELNAHVLPKGADDQRLQLARRLAGNDHTMDLMLMDVVWTAEFANAGWMVPVPDALAKEVEATNLPGPVETALWKRPDDAAKRLYAIPIWTNTELLWFRPDLMAGTPSAERAAKEQAALDKAAQKSKNKKAPKKRGSTASSTTRSNTPSTSAPTSAAPKSSAPSSAAPTPSTKAPADATSATQTKVSTAPRTWDEMLADTKVIAEKTGISQIMVQAKQYEGLMAWFNSLLASAGGAVLDPNDPEKQTLNDTPEHRAATLKALQVMKAVATADGHDPEISQSDETSARLGMEKGKAAFEVNWPFVWAGARTNAAAGNVGFLQDIVGPYSKMLVDSDGNELKGDAAPSNEQLAPINAKMRSAFDFALYPGIFPGKTAKSTIGGFNMAVASTSEQPDLAFEAAKCMTGENAQKVYAVSGGTPPTIASLYDDPDFKLAYPMGDVIRDQLKEGAAAVRPASPQYQAISTLVTATLSPVGRWDPESMVDELAKQVQKAIDGEGIIP